MNTLRPTNQTDKDFARSWVGSSSQGNIPFLFHFHSLFHSVGFQLTYKTLHLNHRPKIRSRGIRAGENLYLNTRFLQVVPTVGQHFPDPMHAARGGWLGQTYALAKFDDSFEGKKSGIRRSKEERKGMVETFIKRYQHSNNGDFPSLNLTRKEVGGSFYTVREIVREIIQENRVLGPPKSPPGDQNREHLDSFLEHYPSDSMPVDLHVQLVHTKEAQTQPEYAFISEKVLNSRSITELHQGNNEAFENLKNTELLMEGSMGEQKDKVHEVVANVTQTHQISEDVDKTLEEEIAHPLKESKSMLESQKGQGPSSTKENLVFDVNGSTDVKLQDTLLAEQKTINGTNAQNLHSKTSGNPVQEPTLDERSANLNQSSDQPGASSENRNNATLNRVDLKSWKAASKKSKDQETHQLLKFVRSFITALVKFWSE
ncbi:hypothetical protein L1987_78944 [Smallanthus sonchifolius]|uniref:Uncharacterized protein n=1 Tax=Smallanthus sonchifolius TaxID=185202 RepID=A0ACB8ZEA1_9ASTR|nr:hypothetical protein L1987_78944 [Smallanthus sonchifolius]